VETLSAGRVDAVVDATHPFAVRITDHALEASTRLGVPLRVLRRPGWTEGPGDDWRRVADVASAAALARDAPPGTVLLTLGRRGLAPFAADASHRYVIRSVSAPDAAEPRPPRQTLVLARGPFTPDAERALLREHAVTMLVTKDSGGTATAAKLLAARELGLPVIMIDRPPLPPAAAVAASVADAERWVLDLVVR
jgi:precorrin-6A/cobalt-precorrin-6A reductase